MTTLNMWIWGAGTTSKQLVKREARAFKSAYQDLDVEVTLIPWRDAWDSIMKAANEKQGPDLLQVGSTWNGTLAHMGVLKDITQEVYDAGINADLFIPAAWSSCHFPGSERVSSMPWFADIRAIYYRTDIFAKLGISTEGLDTWESFEGTCKKLKGFKKEDKEIGVLGVSGQQEALLLHNVAPWIWGAGGNFLTPDGKKAAFNSKEALEGLEFYIKLIKEGYISQQALELSTEQIAKGFFSRGEFAMSIPGPLSDSSPLDPADPLYCAEIATNCTSSLFPVGPKGRSIFCGGSNIAITSFSQKSVQAWQFVKYLMSYESQSRYPKTLNMFPGLLESFDSIFIEERPEWKGLRDSWKYGRAFPNVAVWGEIEALLIESFGAIFARIQEGDYDFNNVTQTLNQAAAKVDDILAK
ncbi:MAG: extracellular solute-binding protein [bacterium]